jgi:ligand-binding SRPBCC domain-containing protein
MKRVRFRSRFPVAADDLYSWHARDGAFERLVPPWQRVEVASREGSIRDGDVLTMQLSFGPLRTTWIALHDSHVEGEQFRDTQIRGPFRVWKHTHRMHAESLRSSVLEDDIVYEVPFEQLVDRFVPNLVHSEIRRMFRFRHLRTRMDVSRHDRFLSEPRIDFALLGNHPFAKQVRAFLTGGGHREVDALNATTLIDMRHLTGAASQVLFPIDNQHVITLYPRQDRPNGGAGTSRQTGIAVPPVVIGPSFKMPGLLDRFRASDSRVPGNVDDWIAEDDLIWWMYCSALRPGQASSEYTRSFATQDAARRFIAGRL